MKSHTERLVGSVAHLAFALLSPSICGFHPLLAEARPEGYLHIWGDASFEGQVQASEPSPNEIGLVTSFATRGGLRSALRADGSALTWSQSDITVVERVEGAPKIISLHEAYFATYALLESGRIIDWPQKNYSDLGAPSGAVEIEQIAAGRLQVLGLKEDGSVISWGIDKTGTDAPFFFWIYRPAKSTIPSSYKRLTQHLNKERLGLLPNSVEDGIRQASDSNRLARGGGIKI